MDENASAIIPQRLPISPNTVCLNRPASFALYRLQAERVLLKVQAMNSALVEQPPNPHMKP